MPGIESCVDEALHGAQQKQNSPILSKLLLSLFRVSKLQIIKKFILQRPLHLFSKIHGMEKELIRATLD